MEATEQSSDHAVDHASPAITQDELKNIIEAALMVANAPLKIEDLAGLFNDYQRPTNAEIRTVLDILAADYSGRGIELKHVASGYRIQARSDYAEWLNKLWEERPPRYSRATLETLALIAYRQPITRGEIEDIRGVSVSSNIMRGLLEREWVRVLGHRDVPGRPAMYGTTKTFLDYFNLRSLDELPTLQELRDIDSINAELDLSDEAESASGNESDQHNHHEPASDLDTDDAESTGAVDGAIDETKAEDNQH